MKLLGLLFGGGWMTWLFAGAAALAVLGGLYWYVYSQGYHAAEVKCNAAQLEREIAALRLDLGVAQAALDHAEQLRRAAAIRAALLEDRLEDFTVDVVSDEPSICAYTDAELDSLRGITAR